MSVVATFRLTSTTAGDLPLTRTLHRSRDKPSVIELGMHILCNESSLRFDLRDLVHALDMNLTGAIHLAAESTTGRVHRATKPVR